MKSASESIYETVISLRNIIIRGVYKNILKKIFFQIDPEQVHAYVIKRGTFLGSDTITKYLVSFIFDYKNKNGKIQIKIQKEKWRQGLLFR